MVKKMLKSKSKRVPAKQRYKVEKRVRTHNKKLRREEKIKQKGRKWKTTKMISVPGDCPFREKILIEAKEARDRIKEERTKKKADKKAKKNEEKIGESLAKRMMDGNKNKQKDPLSADKAAAKADKIVAKLVVKRNSMKKLKKSKKKMAKKADELSEVIGNFSI